MMGNMSSSTRSGESFSVPRATSFFWIRRMGGRPTWRWMSVAFFSVATFRIVERSTRRSCVSILIASPSVRFDGGHHAQDLFEGDDAFPGLDQGILEQGAHSMTACDLRHVARGRLVKDETAQVVIHLHHFMNAGTPAVARTTAFRTADTLVERDVFQLAPRAETQTLERRGGRDIGLLAIGADLARQALGRGPDERRRDEERLDAHVDQSCGDRGRVVGVDRGQDKVPGQGGLDGDLCRLAVTDLTDEHDVGVLTQDAAHTVGKRHVGLDVDLHLVDSVHLVFDRVLDRDDVLTGRIQTVERGVEGRRLAGAGRAGDDDHAVRLADDIVEQGQRIIEESKVLEWHHGSALVQDTHNDLLAIDGGQGADAEVDGLVLDAQGDAAILRLAPLGDIHVGHDLDAGEHAGLDIARQCLLFLQDAVDTVADTQVILLWLHVDIRRALDDGLSDDRVDQSDDGRVLTHLAQLLDADLFTGFRDHLGLRL